MTKLNKAKSAIIKVAKEFGLQVSNSKYKKMPAFSIYEFKEDVSVTITNKELLEAILKIDKKVDDLDDRLTARLDGIDSRLDNLVKKNKLVE